MIGFVMKQDSAFFGQSSSKDTETQQRVKLDVAFGDNYSRMASRKLRKRINILNKELKLTSDLQRQNEILSELTEVKNKQNQLNKK